jgi:hypothetical protein
VFGVFVFVVLNEIIIFVEERKMDIITPVFHILIGEFFSNLTFYFQS